MLWRRLPFHLWLTVLAVLFFSVNLQGARAEFRVGWKNQVDVANLIQLDNKHQAVGHETLVWKKYDDDLKALHDLAKKKVDAVSVDMVSLLSVVTVGLQARIVAVDRQNGVESALFVRDQSHIGEPRDLIGKIIAVPFMTSSHYSLLRYLQHVHITDNQIKLLDMKPDAIVQAWQKGQIDGAYVDGSSGFRFDKDGHSLVTSAQLAEWGYPTYQFWVVMDETVADHLYIMQDFVDRNLKEINEFKQKQKRLTVSSPEVTGLAKLVNIPPETVLLLLKTQTYPGAMQQSLIFSRYLNRDLNTMALFLRSQHVMPEILSDYLIYVYGSFVTSSNIK